MKLAHIPSIAASLLLAGTQINTVVAQNCSIDSRVKDAFTTETPINGVSTTPDGRLFLLYARVDGSTGPTVVEWKNNTAVPYPNLEWNTYTNGSDPATHFVRINSQRVGPDGQLWIVDVGS